MTMTRTNTTDRPRRRRRVKTALPATAFAAEAERTALGCLAAIFRDHPQEATTAIVEVDSSWFDTPAAGDLLDCMKAAAAAQHPTGDAIGSYLRHLVEKAGFVYDESPERALLQEAWGMLVGPVEDLRWKLDKALELVRTAAGNRAAATKALKTLEEMGMTPAAPAATAIAKPARLLRGVPVIRVELANRAEVIDQAEALLADQFFVRDGRLVTVGDGAVGPAITPATKERVADRLERVCSFVEVVRDKEGRTNHIPMPCPGWLPPHLVGKQVWPAIREIRGIMSGPYLRPDGTIGGTTAGYDKATRLLTLTDTDWSAIIDEPTASDVSAAVDELLDVIKDFPFEAGTEAVGRSVWLAALLTLVGRPAFDGPSPLFLFDATTAGSGKTTLAKLIAVIARGIDPPLAGMPEAMAELKKALTAALMRGDSMHVFDNCTGLIGNEVLDMLLTSTNYQDRRLGTNETIVAEARMLLVATSNNAGLRADTARRTLTLRLRPLTDHPEEQEFDRDPVVFAASQRHRLLPAALTILRWHHLHAGEAVAPVRPFGSFTGWSDAVRMAVVRAGLADPVESQAMVRRIDDDSRLRASLLEAWEAWRPGFRGSARAIIAKLFDTGPDKVFTDDSPEADTMRAVVAELTNCTATRPGPQEVRRLGFVIRGMRGRLFAGRCVDSDGHGKEGNVWRLATASGLVPEDDAAVDPDIAAAMNW